MRITTSKRTSITAALAEPGIRLLSPGFYCSSGILSHKMSLTDSSPLNIAEAASTASRNLAILPTQARNDALTAMHGALQESKDTILAANARDLKLATKAAEHGKLSQSVLKRLDLGRKDKWEDMLQGILDVRDLEDPGEGFLRRSAIYEG